MERKTGRLNRRPGTAPLDPAFERAAFMVEYEQEELVAVIPKMDAGPGKFVY